MSGFEEFWIQYQQTNDGWKGLAPREAAHIGWNARQPEVTEAETSLIEWAQKYNRTSRELLVVKAELECLKFDKYKKEREIGNNTGE